MGMEKISRQIEPQFEQKTEGAEPLYPSGVIWHGEKINRFTSEDLAITKAEVEGTWKSLGIDMAFDWNKVELRETEHRDMYGVKRALPGFEQHGDKLIISIPHYKGFLTRNDSFFRNTKEGARLRLRHEATHTSGYNKVIEESKGATEREYEGYKRKMWKRVQYSGLMTKIEETNEHGILPDRIPMSFHMLNEAFTSMINKDHAYPKSRAIFRLIVRELSFYASTSEHHVLKQFARAYVDGWTEELQKLIKGKYGETGFKILEQMTGNWYEEGGPSKDDMFYDFFAGKQHPHYDTPEKVFEHLNKALNNFYRPSSGL